MGVQTSEIKILNLLLRNWYVARQCTRSWNTMMNNTRSRLPPKRPEKKKVSSQQIINNDKPIVEH